MAIIFADGESWSANGRTFYLLLDTARNAGPLPDGVTDRLLDGLEGVKGISFENLETPVQESLARMLFEAASRLADQSPAPFGKPNELREMFLEISALLKSHYGQAVLELE